MWRLEAASTFLVIGERRVTWEHSAVADTAEIQRVLVCPLFVISAKFLLFLFRFSYADIAIGQACQLVSERILNDG
ncbi:MAG: hypothetical protein Tsb002_07090 [Wenzhouxiangellaceae bacterium]